MNGKFFSVVSINRRLTTGNVEELIFKTGVNVLVGRPNTGKTKWLEALDFLLGDTGRNPFELLDSEGLGDKYEAAGAILRIGDETLRVERKWKESGAKGKIFVDGEAMLAREFQHWLMNRLDIPLVNFPKGNPMSGQTWPELTFRTFLRHIYRQQRFWSGLVDQQTDTEQHASILLFLGLADKIYSEDYGDLVKLTLESNNLKSRREQYSLTLNDLAVDLLDADDADLGINDMTVLASQRRLEETVTSLYERRRKVLEAASYESLPVAEQSRVSVLSHQRAAALEALTTMSGKRQAAEERLAEIYRYRKDLAEEIERMARAADAGSVLSDLRVTHCPACDQAIAPVHSPDHCFVCHQHLPDRLQIEGLGAVRLKFEQDRLSGELSEADTLIEVLRRDVEKWTAELKATEESLQSIEVELAPARRAIGALAQADVTAVDVALGQVAERRRQIDRVAGALELGKKLTEQVRALEARIKPLAERVNETARAIDFDAASKYLEDGMNAYLAALNKLRPDTWKHNAVEVDLSKSSVIFRVGRKKWQGALGGTDSLYFLMAYHYGLLSLSVVPGMHYPGFAIIDVPGEFSGEAIEDKENFIVQPFIELLGQPEYEGAQLIITGASFAGLLGVHSQTQTHVYVA